MELFVDELNQKATNRKASRDYAEFGKGWRFACPFSFLFVRRGVAKYLRSDNGSDFTAHKVRD